MHIRSAFLALSATLLASTAALAADLPARTYTQAPVYAPAPIFNWTGFYAGGNIGGGWADVSSSVSFGGVSLSGSETLSGIVGGGQIVRGGLAHLRNGQRMQPARHCPVPVHPPSSAGTSGCSRPGTKWPAGSGAKRGT